MIAFMMQKQEELLHEDDDEKKDLDRTFGGFGLNVFIDSRSLLYLAGSTLDYNDGLMESGFKVENPNANSTCGCGESFSA